MLRRQQAKNGSAISVEPFRFPISLAGAESGQVPGAAKSLRLRELFRPSLLDRFHLPAQVGDQGGDHEEEGSEGCAAKFASKEVVDSGAPRDDGLPRSGPHCRLFDVAITFVCDDRLCYTDPTL